MSNTAQNTTSENATTVFNNNDEVIQAALTYLRIVHGIAVEIEPKESTQGESGRIEVMEYSLLRWVQETKRMRHEDAIFLGFISKCASFLIHRETANPRTQQDVSSDTKVSRSVLRPVKSFHDFIEEISQCRSLEIVKSSAEEGADVETKKKQRRETLLSNAALIHGSFQSFLSTTLSKNNEDNIVSYDSAMAYAKAATAAHELFVAFVAKAKSSPQLGSPPSALPHLEDEDETRKVIIMAIACVGSRISSGSTTLASETARSTETERARQKCVFFSSVVLIWLMKPYATFALSLVALCLLLSCDEHKSAANCPPGATSSADPAKDELAVPTRRAHEWANHVGLHVIGVHCTHGTFAVGIVYQCDVRENTYERVYSLECTKDDCRMFLPRPR